MGKDLEEKFAKIGDLRVEVMEKLEVMQESLSSFKPHEAMAAIEQKLKIIQELGESLK